MPRIATRHAHKLAYRQRFSLGVRMLGCLALLAGAILLAAAAAEAAKAATSSAAWRMASLGGALAALGTLLCGGQRGKLLDRKAGTLTTWWGVVWPLWRATFDLHHYQAVEVESYEAGGAIRWRVCLQNAQAEPLELFDVASCEAAQGAARQVAKFLSWTTSPRAGSAAAPAPAETVAAKATIEATAPPVDFWVYSQHFGASVRLLGVALTALASMLLLGLVGSSSAAGPALGWLGAAAPLLALGLWLFCGGRKVEVDAVAQTVRAWRAWPLPPATYELSAFNAIIVAPAERDAPEAPRRLVGLIGARQARLTLIAALPPEAAQAAAADLAAATRLPMMHDT